MSSPALAKDVQKRSSDLIKKQLPSKDEPALKVDWKGVSEEGVTLEVNIKQDAKGTSGVIKPKYKISKIGNVEVNGEINTNGNFSGEVAVQDELLKGLKTTVKAEKSKDGVFATFGLEYKNERLSATASADYGKESGSALGGSLSVAVHQGFLVAASAEYFAGAPSNRLTKATAIAAYASKGLDVAAFDRYTAAASAGGDAKSEVGLGFYHAHASGEVVSAGEVVRDLSGEKTSLVLATQWSPLADSKFKASYATTGLLAVSWQQQFNKRVSSTVGALVDTANFSKGPVSLHFATNIE